MAGMSDALDNSTVTWFDLRNKLRGVVSCSSSSFTLQRKLDQLHPNGGREE